MLTNKTHSFFNDNSINTNQEAPFNNNHSKKMDYLPLEGSAQTPPTPISPAEVGDVEHTVIIEGLRGKVKGLEQTIVTERNAVKGLRDMVVDLSERVNSSLSTAVPS